MTKKNTPFSTPEEEVVVAKKRGRPKMTEEQKAEARRKRALKKARELAEQSILTNRELTDGTPLAMDLGDDDPALDGALQAIQQMGLEDLVKMSTEGTPKKTVKKTTDSADGEKKVKTGFQQMTPGQRKKITEATFGMSFENLGVRDAKKFYQTHECSRELIGYMAKRYIQVQTDRIRVNGQRTAMLNSILQEKAIEQGVDDVKKIVYSEQELYNEHPEMLSITAAVTDAERVEDNAAKLLDAVTSRSCLAQYLRQIQGIGPVVAGLIAANIDITKFKYPSNLVSYAGLSNVHKWYNATEARNYLNEAFQEAGSRFLNDHEIAQVQDAVKLIKESSVYYINPNNGQKVSRYPDDVLEQIPVLEDNLNEVTENSTVNGPFLHAFRTIVSVISTYKVTDDLEKAVRARIINTGATLPLDQELENLDLDPEVIKELKEAEDAILNAKINKDDLSDEFLVKLGQLTHRAYNTVLKYCTVVDEESGEAIRSYSELQVRLTKRPFNAALKRALFLFQDQVIKRHNDPRSLYGQLYNEFLEDERRKNERGENRTAAEWSYKTRKYGKNTKSYAAMQEGRLTNGHMMNRALRKVKVVLLNHIFEAAWYFEDPTGHHPLSYVFDELKHTDYRAPEVDYKKFYADFYKDTPKQ